MQSVSATIQNEKSFHKSHVLSIVQTKRKGLMAVGLDSPFFSNITLFRSSQLVL